MTQQYQLEIVFFDHKSDFETETKTLFDGLEFNDPQRKITFSFRTQSILECPEFLNSSTEKNVCWVSPANSFGEMNGGIDYYLDDFVLQDISILVKKRINEIGQINKMNKKYLPIGSCILVQHPNSKQFLVSAPTMLIPSDVSMTKNAQHVFCGILALINHHNMTTPNPNLKITKLMCCGLATGVGGMEFPELAKQLKDGFDDFTSVITSNGSKSFVGQFSPVNDAYIRTDLTIQQPSTKSNNLYFGVPYQANQSNDDENSNGSDYEEIEFSESDLEILSQLDLSALGFDNIEDIDKNVLNYILEQVKN